MRIEVNGDKTFVSTGGRAFDPEGAVLLFVHGSGQSHLSWLLQARFFANRGWQVLAPDLPGHYLSAGAPPESVEATADWCADLLAATGVSSATIIGHSQGALATLEMARRHPDHVEKIAMIGCAQAIPVNDMLIEMATNAEDKAIRFMVSWSHGSEGHRHDHTVPGQSHLLFGNQVMGQNAEGILLSDLKACNAYKSGEEAAKAVTCPALLILAQNDRMVPMKFGLKLGEVLPDCQTLVVEDAGHFVQSEKSVETNAALRPFFPSC